MGKPGALVWMSGQLTPDMLTEPGRGHEPGAHTEEAEEDEEEVVEEVEEGGE